MAATTPAISPSDESLAQLIARRGPADDGASATARDAFDQLHRRHAGLLVAFLAARVPRSDLDDLLQDVWQRVWERLPRGFEERNFRAWLHQIARNALIDHGRKKRPGAIVEEAAIADRRPAAPDERLLECERQEILRRCLDRLAAESAALVRARLGGESYAEICRRLGLKAERAHKMFHQAKDQLQNCVERSSS